MLSNVYFTAMLLIPFMIQQALSTLCFRRSQFLVCRVYVCVKLRFRAPAWRSTPATPHTLRSNFFSNTKKNVVALWLPFGCSNQIPIFVQKHTDFSWQFNEWKSFFFDLRRVQRLVEIEGQPGGTGYQKISKSLDFAFLVKISKHYWLGWFFVTIVTNGIHCFENLLPEFSALNKSVWATRIVDADWRFLRVTQNWRWPESTRLARLASRAVVLIVALKLCLEIEND